MKLKILMSSVDSLKNTLGSIVSLRKYGVLRFTPTHLNIISSSLAEPQVWCKISNDIFDIYEVESLRDNTISFEMNVDQLFQVLKQFEKSNADELSIRLQKKSTNGAKRSASLALFFNNSSSVVSTVNHTYNISVKLLRRESDERIIEPSLDHVDVMLKFPDDISQLFKRIERYKSSGNLKVIGTNQGSLSLNIEEENNLNVTITWNERLHVQGISESSSQDEQHEVMVKLKDWRLGSKICEICKNIVLIISSDEALVFHCSLDETESCQIIYFINAVVL